MSHTVTVTRTTTSTTTSAIILNTGYLKTWPGLLKLAELILGIAIVGVMVYWFNHRRLVYGTETFFYLVAVAFLVGTFLILLSCLISLSTASILSKTIYEVVYHGFAFIVYLVASILFLVEVNRYKNYYSSYDYYMAAGVLGLVLAVCYLLSTIFAQRTYRGL